jgi:hypothetical protein
VRHDALERRLRRPIEQIGIGSAQRCDAKVVSLRTANLDTEAIMLKSGVTRNAVRIQMTFIVVDMRKAQ